MDRETEGRIFLIRRSITRDTVGTAQRSKCSGTRRFFSGLLASGSIRPSVEFPQPTSFRRSTLLRRVKAQTLRLPESLRSLSSSEPTSLQDEDRTTSRSTTKSFTTNQPTTIGPDSASSTESSLHRSRKSSSAKSTTTQVQSAPALRQPAWKTYRGRWGTFEEQRRVYGELWRKQSGQMICACR
jgi:hypothetical protein